VSYQTRSCVWARATENIKGILHALQLLQGSKLLRCLLGSCFAVDLWILVCSLSRPPLHAFSEIAVYVRHHGHPICFFFWVHSWCRQKTAGCYSLLVNLEAQGFCVVLGASLGWERLVVVLVIQVRILLFLAMASMVPSPTLLQNSCKTTTNTPHTPKKMFVFCQLTTIYEN